MRYLQGVLVVLCCLIVGFSTGKAGKQDRQSSDAENQDSYGWVIEARQSHIMPMAPGTMERVTIIWDQESIDRRLAHPHSPVTEAIVDWHKRHVHTALSLLVQLYSPCLDGRKGFKPVKVTPYCTGDMCLSAGDKNAFFLPDENSLTFGLFKEAGRWKAMCGSLDIVLHEGGHWLLHQVRPELSNVNHQQNGALGEVFADLSAYFWREWNRILPFSDRANTCLGADIEECFREIRNSITLRPYRESEASCEVHQLSLFITGAIVEAYEGLSRTFNVREVASYVVKVYATAFFTLDKREAHFEGFTLKVMKGAETFPTLRRALGESFLKRGFLAIGPRQGMYVPDKAKTFCQEKKVSQTHQIRATPKKQVTQKKKKYVLVK